MGRNGGEKTIRHANLSLIHLVYEILLLLCLYLFSSLSPSVPPTFPPVRQKDNLNKESREETNKKRGDQSKRAKEREGRPSMKAMEKRLSFFFKSHYRSLPPLLLSLSLSPFPLANSSVFLAFSCALALSLVLSLSLKRRLFKRR